MLVVPFWILGQWAARSGESPSLATFLGLAIGFVVILPLSLAIHAALTRPFCWALRRFFGIEVRFHSRQFW